MSGSCERKRNLCRQQRRLVAQRPERAGVRLRFGAPLDFSRYADRAGDRFVERTVTDEIMYELMTLTGRPYVDVYAATLKTAVVAPTPAVTAALPSPPGAAGPTRR